MDYEKLSKRLDKVNRKLEILLIPAIVMVIFILFLAIISTVLIPPTEKDTFTLLESLNNLHYSLFPIISTLTLISTIILGFVIIIKGEEK